jgi:type VI secretion system ImpB/VipA family protein
MSLSISFGRLTSSQSVGTELPGSDTPFRIAVLGDFSGRTNRKLLGSPDEIARRRPRKVDGATLDEVMAKLKVEIGLPIGPKGATVTLSFASLEDFHPDALHSHVEPFSDCFDREEKAELMTKILHHPEFQALESAWRGLDWLLRGIVRCGAVEVRLLDLSFEELVADLSSAEELEATGLYQILVDQPAGRGELDPWSVLVGLYDFEPSAAHVDLLGRLAKIARQSSAPFLAGAHPRVLGAKYEPDEEAASAWDALRKLPESGLLGLATPRFLLRPPYGENTKSIDSFEYEEYTPSKDWNGYLWGNTALGCACLLAKSFGKDGWKMKSGSVLDLAGMAMHVTQDEDDESVSILAESWLTRPASEKLVGFGLMALLCVRGRDSVELLSFHSLATPPKGQRAAALLGRWEQTGSVKFPRSGAPAPAPPAPAAAPAAAPASAPPPPVSESIPDTVPEVAPEPEPEIDPELAALLGELENLETTPSPADTPEAAPEDEVDPELAAMLAELDNIGVTPSEPPPAEPPPVADEPDPELAALLAELDSIDTSTEAPPEPETEDTEEPETTAEDEVDPELAAMLAELDAPAEVQAPPEPEVDPELAALLAGIDETATPAAGEEEVDPELAALLSELDSTPAEDPAEEEVDPELAALLGELGG